MSTAKYLYMNWRQYQIEAPVDYLLRNHQQKEGSTVLDRHGQGTRKRMRSECASRQLCVVWLVR